VQDNFYPNRQWILKSFSNKEEYEKEKNILVHLSSLPDFPVPYFCMMKTSFHQNILFPYCNQLDLYEYIYHSSPKGSFSHQDSVTFIQHLLRALVFLQEHSYQHYDIKMENIFVHRNSLGCLTFQLGDLEFMDLYQQRKSVVGTYRYMSPELIYTDLSFHCCQCDIFSFGRILCMLFLSSFDKELEKYTVEGKPFTYKVYHHFFRFLDPSSYKYPPLFHLDRIHVIDSSLFLDWIRGHCYLDSSQRFTAQESFQFFEQNHDKMFLSILE
jgi:serine/threonine protein kinase